MMNLEQPVRDGDAEIRIGRRSGLGMYLSPRLLVRPNLKRNRKFVDSPLEGSGFEPSVPASARRFDASAPVRAPMDAPLRTGENEVIAGAVASPFIFSVSIS